MKAIPKAGLIYFTSMYLGFGGYAVCDYKINHAEEIKQKAKNTLVVKNYKVNLEDKVKELTILGEVHVYNYKESEFAEDFIDNFDYVACEGGYKEDIGIMLQLFFRTYSIPLKFYGLGSGRHSKNATMHSWAKEKGKTIYYLEKGEDSYKDNMSLGQKLTLTGQSLFSLAIGPLFYFIGKDDLKREFKTRVDYEYWDSDFYSEGNTEEDEDLIDWAANIKERDKIMVKNILKVLEKEDVDSLLCIMGKAHVPGVLKNLKGKVKIKKLDNPKRL